MSPIPHSPDQGASSLITTIARLPHFSDLSPAILDSLVELSSSRHYQAGQVIYLEGEPADYIYILARGWVKATRMSRDGREQAMLFLQPVEIFGDIAAFTGTTYPGTTTALEPVDVWVIPSAALLSLLDKYPQLSRSIIRKLGDRVLHYIDLVEDLSLRCVESRLASTLLQHAVEMDGSLVVPRRAWTTFDEMAVRLGTVRDVLSRALKTLETEGLIRVDKEKIVLLNARQLTERGSL